MKKILSILTLTLICTAAKGDDQIEATAVCDAASAVCYTPQDATPYYRYIHYDIASYSDNSMTVSYEIADSPVGLVPKLQYIIGNNITWINEAVENNGNYSFHIAGPFESEENIHLNLFLSYDGGQSVISTDYIYGSNEDMIEPLTLSAEIDDVTSTGADLRWYAEIGGLRVPATLHYSFDNATTSTVEVDAVAFTDLQANTDYDVSCFAEIELSGDVLTSEEITLEFTTLEQPEDGIDLIEAEKDVPTEYYNLQGIRINYPRRGTMVICKRGDKITKLVYK